MCGANNHFMRDCPRNYNCRYDAWNQSVQQRRDSRARESDRGVRFPSSERSDQHVMSNKYRSSSYDDVGRLRNYNNQRRNSYHDGRNGYQQRQRSNVNGNRGGYNSRRGSQNHYNSHASSGVNENDQRYKPGAGNNGNNFSERQNDSGKHDDGVDGDVENAQSGNLN